LGKTGGISLILEQKRTNYHQVFGQLTSFRPKIAALRRKTDDYFTKNSIARNFYFDN
jgi:hypothetical protein